MATWRERVCASAAVAGLMLGGAQAISRLAPQSPSAPSSPQELREERLRDQEGQLADSEEANKDRLRREGEDLQNANERDRLRGAEHRPPPDPPRVKVRIR